jgi:hypothetical protein
MPGQRLSWVNNWVTTSNAIACLLDVTVVPGYLQEVVAASVSTVFLAALLLVQRHVLSLLSLQQVQQVGICETRAWIAARNRRGTPEAF